MSSDDFCVFRLQADTLDFNKFFHRVYGQRFESATKLLKLVGINAEKRSEEPNFTYVFGAVEQKLLLELVTEEMHQIFRTAKSIEKLRDADTRVLEMFLRVFD